MTCLRSLVVLFIAVVVRLNSPTSAAEFIPLGFGVGQNTFFNCMNVSSDGTIVAASTKDHELVRWSRDGGLEVLLQDTWMADLSGDGETIVTSRLISEGTPNLYEALIVRGDEVEPLPVDRPSSGSEALLISDDGHVIGGRVRALDLDPSYVSWSEAGLVDLPIRINMNGISGNGEVVVGAIFRWSESEGLHELEGLGDIGGNAFGVSSSGQWTVGAAYAPSPWDRVALRWDGLSSPLPMYPPADGWGSMAIDVSANGEVVVGRLYELLDEDPQELEDFLRAGIWTEETEQMVLLQDLLTQQYDLQNQLQDWILTDVSAVTNDGRYLVGTAHHTDGYNEAYLVDLGLRGDLDNNETLDVADVDQLASAIASGALDLSFDVNWSGAVDVNDLNYWVKSLKKTWFGDANLDGKFDSDDFVQVFDVGKYETQQAASWAEGDWNGDGVFGTADLVKALEDGGYEQGPRTDAVAVPEPGAWSLLMMGLLPWLAGRRRRCPD
jgi:uncharacterized membrane protein